MGIWSTITSMTTTTTTTTITITITIMIITTTITKRFQSTTIVLAIMMRETAATTRWSLIIPITGMLRWDQWQ
jgi:hypothetical protein